MAELRRESPAAHVTPVTQPAPASVGGQRGLAPQPEGWPVIINVL